MNIEKNLQGTWWWGYLHSNGTIQLKRWLGDHDDYTRDCEGNPFVITVVRPFKAPTWDDAIKIISMQLKGDKK
jgi:hypothetical protein